MEIYDISEASTSLYSFSTFGSSTEGFYDVEATEFDTPSESELDQSEEEDTSHLIEFEEGYEIQLLQTLPVEVFQHILEYCTPNMLCILARCCTSTLAMSSQSWLWKDLLMRQWGPDIVDGISKKKKKEYNSLSKSILPRNSSISELSQASNSSSSSSSSRSSNTTSQISNTRSQRSKNNSISRSHSNSVSSIESAFFVNSIADGIEAWEDWKAWYREVHQAARLIKFDVKHGIKCLVDNHGLPNTTESIARLLKYSTQRLAAFALRNFLDQQSNINITSYFLRLWNFKGISVLQMMRLVLGFIRLPKSDSSITRLLEILALAWWEQNEPAIGGEENNEGIQSEGVEYQNENENNQNNQQNNQNNQNNQNINQNTNSNPHRLRSSSNTIRLTQWIHLSPLSTLGSADPWQNTKVPVFLTQDDLAPRGGFYSPDAISTLCFAILMLETDQRTTAVKFKMTESAFVSQSRGLNSGHNYPREMLREVYNSIKFHPLVFFSDKMASGHIQVHTQVPRFLWLSSSRTSDLYAEVSKGMLRVWDQGQTTDHQPLHTIQLSPNSTIVRCDFIGPSWLSASMGADDKPWNAVEIESLSVLGSTFFRFLVPSQHTSKWFSALHWNIHSSILESRAP